MKSSNLWGRIVAVAAMLLVLGGGAAFAQLQTGNLFGTVMDEQGSALPGVTVTLAGSAAPQVQVTNAQGEFRFLGLSPGSYQLKAELEGFSTIEYPNITINIGRNTTIEVTLSAARRESKELAISPSDFPRSSDSWIRSRNRSMACRTSCSSGVVMVSDTGVPGRPLIRSAIDRLRSTVTMPGGRASPSTVVRTRVYDSTSARSARNAAAIRCRSPIGPRPAVICRSGAARAAAWR